MSELWYVRSFFEEGGELVFLDEGPWDYTLASLVLADIGIDASIPRSLKRVTVKRARLVRASEAWS